jgi:hypothetical protein
MASQMRNRDADGFFDAFANETKRGKTAKVDFQQNPCPTIEEIPTEDFRTD